jgi:hypothetical protein
VSELKDKIKEKKLLNDEEFFIYFNGIPLFEDDRTIDDYEIEDLDTVIIVPLFRAG